MLFWPRGLSSRGRKASTRRHNKDTAELKVKTATDLTASDCWPLQAPRVSESTDMEGSYSVGWVIDPDYQGEIGLPLHNGGKEEYVWNIGDHFGCFLVLP